VSESSLPSRLLAARLERRGRRAFRALRSPRALVARTRRAGGPAWSEVLAFPSEPIRGTVIIASTPRSGSSLLASGLRASGRCGAPDELFHARYLVKSAHSDGVPVIRAAGHVKMWMKRLTFNPHWEATLDLDPASIRPYLDLLVERRTTSNGVFALKVHWDQFEPVQHRFGVDESWFPQPVRWIHIRRLDTVAQAVSYERALQTNQWTSLGAVRAPVEEPVYCRERLLDTYRRVRSDAAAWSDYLAQRGIEPIEVVYEDLASDYEATMRRVLAELGESVEVIEPPQLARQADAVNNDWVRRLRLDVTDLDRGSDDEEHPVNAIVGVVALPTSGPRRNGFATQPPPKTSDG